MKKRTYTADETFTAQTDVAHFGPRDLETFLISELRIIYT
jgi:hypothetical protein